MDNKNEKKSLLDIAKENNFLVENEKKDMRTSMKLNKNNIELLNIFSEYQEEKYGKVLNKNQSLDVLLNFYINAVIKNNLDEDDVLKAIFNQKDNKKLANVDINTSINTHILVAIMHHIGIISLDDMEDEGKMYEDLKNEIPDLNGDNADTLFIKSLKDQINHEIHKNYLKH